jgi:hypothetical protein
MHDIDQLDDPHEVKGPVQINESQYVDEEEIDELNRSIDGS